MKGSIANQVNQTWRNVDGIGVSKKEERNKSSYKTLSNKKTSPYVHSFRSKDEFKRIALELGNYAKLKYQINDMQQISNECIISFIKEKIKKGLKYRSISTYIGHFVKLHIALSQMKKNSIKHLQLFERKTLQSLREMAKKDAAPSIHKNRAFINPDNVGIHFQNPHAKLTFEIQRATGLRIREASHIKESQLLGKCTFRIHGKGGYLRDVQVSKELYIKILRDIDKYGIHHIEYNDYHKELKNAAKMIGEIFSSSHSLRYNYVQERMSYWSQLVSRKKAEKYVSYEIGHHRKDATHTYIR